MNAFLQEMMRAGVYKKSQGRITRQVTFAALAITVLLGLWRFSENLRFIYPGNLYLCYMVPGVLLLIGWWACYRAVNLPSFADFLIAVEAEMNKVSWPSRAELVRASIVVLVTIIFLGFILAAFDLMWLRIFTLLRIY